MGHFIAEMPVTLLIQALDGVVRMPGTLLFSSLGIARIKCLALYVLNLVAAV
jgi:hypothetical protein